MRVSHRFVIVVALFVTNLIAANIMAVKLVNISGLTLPAAIIIFPLSYIIGDVLTEVYGYKMARRVIWLGFLCNLIVVIAFWIGKLLPSASIWEGQEAYE
ncbi:MAG: VUT family protein, partial [Chloroflexi bacterium]|nr:VUT family protein [Chloroflexota bacterium]